MGVPGKTEGTIFSPIPCEVILTGPERVGGNILQTLCKVVTCIHNPNKHSLMIVYRIREIVSFELGKNDTVLSLLILAVYRIHII